VPLRRCTFFWFFCRQKFQEPEDPNACPYTSADHMLEHIEAQPQWKQWRAAPLEKRASLAREMAKHFHPDKVSNIFSYFFLRLPRRPRQHALILNSPSPPSPVHSGTSSIRRVILITKV